jgi:alkanesulfonate monooxygenase SsuD/methylene tetrahydromethanopterin reductase-like flavin-dependent oxidoreductase (luciferase family)
MAADEPVAYGAHLPLVDLGTRPTLAGLAAYARAAARLGYRHLCANDHLLFGRPWLDGPTALAAVVAASGDLTLTTTASLPVLRGPVQLAKALAALDLLSGGRLVAGVGPGSSPADYAAAGVAFPQRWRRFDEAVRALRALLHGDPAGFAGEFYATGGVVLEPPPAQRPGPPIWVASWGSVAELRRAGKAPESFPSAVATTWLRVTEDRAEAERTLDGLAALLRRPADELRAAALLIGGAEACAERLAALVAAGARRVFVWPLGDELAQLERFRERVAALVPPPAAGPAAPSGAAPLS